MFAFLRVPIPAEDDAVTDKETVPLLLFRKWPVINFKQWWIQTTKNKKKTTISYPFLSDYNNQKS